MKVRLLVCLFATTAIAALAQNKSETDPLAEAITLRQDLTAAILKGDERPATAMARLRGHASPSGLKVDREADFALAAIDVGQRLLCVGKGTEAEQFFLAAEKSLILAIGNTKDKEAQEKALYLQQLAFIRANFLNETEAAFDDLESAIQLQPDDKQLRDMKQNFARDKAEFLKNKSK